MAKLKFGEIVTKCDCCQKPVQPVKRNRNNVVYCDRCEKLYRLMLVDLSEVERKHWLVVNGE